MAWRAVATSEIRAACMTGMSIARLISPAKSRNGADGVPIDGITRASVASLSMVPLMRLRKSMPSAVYCRSACTASSGPRPSSRRASGVWSWRTSSSIDIRMPTTNSGPTAARIAWMTRRGNAMRCSRLPPRRVGRGRSWPVTGTRRAGARSAGPRCRPARRRGSARAADDVVVDDAVEVPRLGHLGERAVGGLALRRGVDERQPVAGVVARAAAEVRHLAHDCRARLVHVVGQAPQPRHDVVAVEQQVAEGGRAVPRRRPPSRRSWSARPRHGPSRGGRAGSGPSAARPRSRPARARC